MVQNLFSGLAWTSTFLVTDVQATPRIQLLHPISTTQQWLPELSPVMHRTSATMWKRSGLSGRRWGWLVYSRDVRSCDSKRQGWAVFGSKVTGAEEEKMGQRLG